MAKEKKQRVKPQVLKGFRDYPPAEEIAREQMIARVKEVFELMGFLPLQTASLESAEALLGPHYDDESLAELFGFVGPEETAMALRYEFTLSLARYVASNPDLPLPFRRYQYGNVWRVDKPGPGRFREFMQFDIDIVGTSNLLADAEIIAAMVTTFEHLGIRNFEVRYSTRKILNGLIEYAGIPPDKAQDVMRVIDKLERQGREAVVLELGPGRVDQSGDKIKGLALATDQIKQLENFLDVAETKGENALESAEKLLGNIVASEGGIADLRQIQSYLDSMQIDPSKVKIDLTIVRGLSYYTGPVFETSLLDLPEYGAVFSGGRYDSLVDRFLGRSIPAVGSSIGIDRLLAALIELKALDFQQATSKVLVTVMDQERLPDYLAILHDLRAEGIPSEIFSGDTKNLTKQIKYGDRVGIPYVVIAGSDEFEAGTITIKNLTDGREKAEKTADRKEWLKADEIQQTIPAGELIPFLKRNWVSDRTPRATPTARVLP
ncbi:MAG: histidine--tRNA ligase [Candidatus Zixiibacteriota bacterium]|nr:MAG: histidine--tRNA ligase [candidate division Zixibacteria bacterium]